MIHNVVASIAQGLDEYIKNKLSISEDTVIVSSLVDIKGNVNQDIENKITVFLLNIEEEKLTKNSHSQKAAGKNPPVTINVFLMFSAYFPNFNYVESLRYLSLVIEYFQRTPMISTLNSPILSSVVDKLYVEMSNIGIDELNKLWGNLGANYVPSVTYKIKQLRFDGNILSENVPDILGV